MRKSIPLLGAALLLAGAAVSGTVYLFQQKQDTAPVTAAPLKPQSKDEQARERARELVAKYKDYHLVDAHNHDAWKYSASFPLWDQYAVSKIVLFGAVSDPAAVKDDQSTFFSGFDLHSEDGLATVKANLEKGYFGIGEVAAASFYSPQLANIKWKGKSALDGILPQVYELAAAYRVPILLHIDPFDGEQRKALEQALDQHPNTNIIYAHGNVASTPQVLQELLDKHPNLYIDYFAGYTRYSGSPDYQKKFAEVMNRYPDRFFLSTDSGAELNYAKCYAAIYEVLDLLDESVGRQIASGNMTRLIEAQPATETQLQELRQLASQKGRPQPATPLTKREANELRMELSKSKKT